MAYNEKTTYKLNFSFDFLGGITKDEPASSYKEGELFYYNRENKLFYALTDGAKISEGVAAKMGRQMKKKMFVKADIQMF